MTGPLVSRIDGVVCAGLQADLHDGRQGCEAGLAFGLRGDGKQRLNSVPLARPACAPTRPTNRHRPGRFVGRASM